LQFGIHKEFLFLDLNNGYFFYKNTISRTCTHFAVIPFICFSPERKKCEGLRKPALLSPSACLGGWSTASFFFFSDLLGALTNFTGFTLELDLQNEAQSWAALIDYAAITLI
jgi:hypothetical protein